MSSQFGAVGGESSTQSENSMAQREDIHNNGSLAHEDIYNNGVLASSTDLLQRMTLEESAESLQQPESPASGQEETLSLEQRRALAFDHAYCFCQNPHLRDIDYEIAEQLEWYRYNDDPYYSSLDYDPRREPEYIPEPGCI